MPGLQILYDKTVGIVGLGEIGREFALRAAAFGMRILYTQRNRLPEAVEQQFNASYRPMNAMLAESDWVVPLVPGVPETRHLIGAAELAHIKRGARIVNVGRADVIDRAALIAALKSGQVGGFALDPLYEAPGRERRRAARLPQCHPDAAHRRAAAFQRARRSLRHDHGPGARLL